MVLFAVVADAIGGGGAEHGHMAVVTLRLLQQKAAERESLFNCADCRTMLVPFLAYNICFNSTFHSVPCFQSLSLTSSRNNRIYSGLQFVFAAHKKRKGSKEKDCWLQIG